MPSPKSGLYPPSPPPFLKAGGMPARAFPAPGPVVVFLSSRAFWNMTVKPSDVAGFFTSHSPNLGSGCPCPLLSYNQGNATACMRARQLVALPFYILEIAEFHGVTIVMRVREKKRRSCRISRPRSGRHGCATPQFQNEMEMQLSERNRKWECNMHACMGLLDRCGTPPDVRKKKQSMQAVK